MTKPKQEVRIVCVNYGKKGQGHHSSHTHGKRDLATAKQSVVDLDHHAEMHPTSYYSREVPYRIQTREVSKWGDVDDG